MCFCLSRRIYRSAKERDRLHKRYFDDHASLHSARYDSPQHRKCAHSRPRASSVFSCLKRYFICEHVGIFFIFVKVIGANVDVIIYMLIERWYFIMKCTFVVKITIRLLAFAWEFLKINEIISNLSTCKLSSCKFWNSIILFAKKRNERSHYLKQNAFSST